MATTSGVTDVSSSVKNSPSEIYAGGCSSCRTAAVSDCSSSQLQLKRHIINNSSTLNAQRVLLCMALTSLKRQQLTAEAAAAAELLQFLTSITYALSKTRCHSLSSFPSQNCIRSFTIPCPQLYGTCRMVFGYIRPSFNYPQ